ncbi:MAG TPA: Holliday junction branch migration protein RuvA, partial [Anseongella sp.]|nr:Holliday junction branch migration protein RuvA [Anseongella sp.]
QGKLIFLCPTYAVIEAGGLGYHINISLTTYSAIAHFRESGEKQLKLFTFFHVKEDAHTLYGFAEETERRLFTQLISISGIGPNTGRMILSSIGPGELEEAIVEGNVNLIKSVKGIGPKSAQRIVLELQDKLKKEGSSSLMRMPPQDTVREEALSALIMLGFTRSVADKTLATILKKEENSSVEVLIKNALKLL